MVPISAVRFFSGLAARISCVSCCVADRADRVYLLRNVFAQLYQDRRSAHLLNDNTGVGSCRWPIVCHEHRSQRFRKLRDLQAYRCDLISVASFSR